MRGVVEQQELGPRDRRRERAAVRRRHHAVLRAVHDERRGGDRTEPRAGVVGQGTPRAARGSRRGGTRTSAGARSPRRSGRRPRCASGRCRRRARTPSAPPRPASTRGGQEGEDLGVGRRRATRRRPWWRRAPARRRDPDAAARAPGRSCRPSTCRTRGRARSPPRRARRPRPRPCPAIESGPAGSALRPEPRLSKLMTRNERASTGTVRHHASPGSPRPITSRTAGPSPVRFEMEPGRFGSRRACKEFN